MKSIIVTVLTTAFVVVACDAPVDDDFRRKSRGAAEDEAAPGAPSDPTQPGACATGTAHPGFANHDFVGDRPVGGLGLDRRRIKPFESLDSEFKRVLGAAPSTLTQSAAAFGDVPARWYAEPVAGAVSLYTSYSLAFSACYDSMTDAKYAAAPTVATATAECNALAQKAWQRTPAADETKGCIDLAVTTLANEAQPRRRWAHACAAILGAAGFISY